MMKNKVLDNAEQGKDEWCEKVLNRVISDRCLVEEAHYYRKCYAKLANNCSSSPKQRRPEDEHFASAFEKLSAYIEDSEECQFGLQNLMKKIEDMMPESSSVTGNAEIEINEQM